MKNKGDDIQVKIENLKCCGNCKYSYMENEDTCCNHPINIHNPISMFNRCVKDWEFDEKNWIERVVDD